MLKKGGVFLSIVLTAGLVCAQDKTAEMFRHDNPNLINLDEEKEYSGSPIIYIQGIKAPEKATNDIEALQLKLFGTKNIQEATKNTLELTPNELPEEPENQVLNFTFENPFHQKIQSGFIRHIPAFFVIIQVMNQQYLRVTESVTVMNTEENIHWTRNFPLFHHATAKLIHYTQNGESFSVSPEDLKDHLSFIAPKPLKLGPNQISFSYQIHNPFQENNLTLDLTGQEISWPIASFRTAIFFPMKQDIKESRLVFGTNKLNIPEIYTQQADFNTNINYEVQRIVPPNASIQLQLQLDTQKLPLEAQDLTNRFILFSGAALLSLYWLCFGWWERKRLKRISLPKIKYPHTILTLANQMGTELTDLKWQQLLDFGQKNSWPLGKLLAEQAAWQKSPAKETFKSSLKNFATLILEPFIGTFLLLIGIFMFYAHSSEKLSLFCIIAFILGSTVALGLLYSFSLKKTRCLYWKHKLTQLSDKTILSGVTTQQVRQIFPLFILTQQQEKWQKNLIAVNPKVAQETHLLEETK